MAATTNWLKKIFSVGTISLVVAIVGLYISYKTLLVDTGGELKISYTEFATHLSEEGISTVILNENSAGCINDLLPRFSNPSNYALKDFYLRYDFSGGSYEIEPTGFYEIAEGRNELVLSLKNTVLPPGGTVQEPILDFGLQGARERTTMTYTVNASFNGCVAPFRQEATYRVVYLPVGRMSEEQWYSRAGQLTVARAVALWNEGAMRKLNVEELPPEVREAVAAAQTTTAQQSVRSESTASPVNEPSVNESTPVNTVEDEAIETSDDKAAGIIKGIMYVLLIAIVFMMFVMGCCGAFVDMPEAWKTIKRRRLPLSELKYYFIEEARGDDKQTGFMKVFYEIYWWCAIAMYALCIIVPIAIIILIILYL